MKPAAIILLFMLIAICFLLGLLHVYWAFNGQWSRKQVIPTQPNGDPLFKIGPISCWLVALVMFGLCYFYYQFYQSALGESFLTIDPRLLDYGIWIVAGGFLVRSIGDFKYVGFFKKIRNSTFGRLDSKYFSPLCFLMGVGSMALYFLT